MPVTIQPTTLKYRNGSGNFQQADCLKGEPGATPNLTVGTVQTGAAGSSASVTITGTAENPVLNMTIPKGDTGDPPTTSQIETAVDAYLDEVITNPDSPPLDRTLSSSSAAAPADMVGELKSALNGNHTAEAGYLLRAKNTGIGFEWAAVGTPTDAQVDSAVSDWLDDHPEATTTVQDGAITYAKINNAVKVGITCSALGMTTVDNNGDNFQILVNAINAGKTVLVDGKYDMNFDKDNCAAITENVNLIGITPDAEFVFKTGKNAFAPTGDIDITIMNVTFDNQISLYKLTLFYVAPADATDVLFKKIYVDGCTFKHTGNQPICLMDYETTVSTAPSASFGINQLIFTHNFCDNVRCFFFRLIGQPIRRAEIVGNQVHNHDHVLYYAAIYNNDTYDSEIKFSREYLLVKDNYIKNDNDYWCVAGNSNYCCFALSESNVIYVVNNYMEGVHSHNDCTITNVYASGEYNYYIGNKRINLASFAEDVGGTTIFRCKGSRKHTLYKNDVYIVEDGYAAAVGETGEVINTVFILQGTDTNNIFIEDCYVYAQGLIGMDFGGNNKNITISRNKILAKLWVKNPMLTVYHGTHESTVIEDNVFEITEIDSNGNFYLIHGQNGTSSIENGVASLYTNPVKKIIIRRNKFYFQNYNAKLVLPIIYKIQANNFIIDDNTFDITTETKDFNLCRECRSAHMSICKNNIFNRPGFYVLPSDHNYIYSHDFDFYESIVKNTISASNVNFLDSVTPYLNKTNYSSIFEIYEFDVLTPTERKIIKFEMLHYVDNGTEKMKVTQDGNVLFDNGQASSSTTETLIDNALFQLKLKRLSTGSSTGFVQLYFKWVSLPVGSITHVVHKVSKTLAPSS